MSLSIYVDNSPRLIQTWMPVKQSHYSYSVQYLNLLVIYMHLFR